MSDILVQGLAYPIVYVDDLEPALAFYETYLNFQKELELGDGSVFGKVGSMGLWIRSGYERQDLQASAVRTSFMLSIRAIQVFFELLNEAGIPCLQKSPLEKQDGLYWFQFEDPAGNILEALGKK